MRRYIGLALLFLVPFSLLLAQDSNSPPKKQLTKEEKLKKIQELEEEGRKEREKIAKEKTKPSVIMQIAVDRECKITVNGKDVTYEKFEVLMEFASSSFTIDEMIYRGGLMSTLKLRTKE